MAVGQLRPGPPKRHPPVSRPIAVAQRLTAAEPPRRSRRGLSFSHCGRVDVRPKDTRGRDTAAVYQAAAGGRRRAPRTKECATARGVDAAGAPALPRRRHTRGRHLPRAAATQAHAVAFPPPRRRAASALMGVSARGDVWPSAAVGHAPPRAPKSAATTQAGGSVPRPRLSSPPTLVLMTPPVWHPPPAGPPRAAPRAAPAAAAARRGPPHRGAAGPPPVAPRAQCKSRALTHTHGQSTTVAGANKRPRHDRRGEAARRRRPALPPTSACRRPRGVCRRRVAIVAVGRRPPRGRQIHVAAPPPRPPAAGDPPAAVGARRGAGGGRPHLRAAGGDHAGTRGGGGAPTPPPPPRRDGGPAPPATPGGAPGGAGAGGPPGPRPG